MSHGAWPELPWRAWGDSLTTLHMWAQIIGKLRIAATPPLSHWWHIPLAVTPRGLTTSAMPYGPRLFQIEVRFYDLDQINQAAADVESGETVKPIIRIG